MNRKHQMEVIGGYYSHLPNFYKKENLCTENHVVYSINGNPVGLVLDGQESTIEARLYGDEAVVVAQDTYFVRNADIKLKMAIRPSEDGLAISFSSDEIATLHQFAGENRTDTVAMLREILPVIKDTRTREITGQAVEKVGRLSDKAYLELIETTKKRFKVENERSIRSRLARAREQMGKREGNRIVEKKRKDR